MGREIRKVPPNWDHPTEGGSFKPMHDQNFDDAAKEWIDRFMAWQRGEGQEGLSAEQRAMPFWEWHGEPPTRAFYRPWKDAEATWFQVWENVTEGTPVTPPFATLQEVEDYLAANGTFWDHGKPWARSAAKSFCADGYAPSFIVVVKPDAPAELYAPRDGKPA